MKLNISCLSKVVSSATPTVKEVLIILPFRKLVRFVSSLPCTVLIDISCSIKKSIFINEYYRVMNIFKENILQSHCGGATGMVAVGGYVGEIVVIKV